MLWASKHIQANQSLPRSSSMRVMGALLFSSLGGVSPAFFSATRALHRARGLGNPANARDRHALDNHSVRLMLNSGAQSSVNIELKMTSLAHIDLHRAAFDGRSTLVRRLIAEGADPNEPDDHGRNALHWATVPGDRRSAAMVGVLLRRGGNPFQPDNKGLTPEDWARARGNRGALRWIRRAGSIDAARRASRSAGFTLVEVLCSIAASVVLSAGVFGFYGHARDAANLETTTETVVAIVTAAERAYAASGDYRNLTTESAVAEGWLPENGRTPAGPVNGFEQPITLGHADGAKPNGALVLTQDLPSGACAALVANTGPSFNRVLVGGQVVDPSNATGVAAACAGGDLVTVEFDRWK